MPNQFTRPQRYTLAELRDGTGFPRGARFVNEERVKLLVQTLAALIASAHVYSDLEVSERGSLALEDARAELGRWS